MNRSEYIAALTAALRGKLASAEIEEIVRDYREFFDDGVAQGKSEEQVAQELGDPREVAEQILSEERDEPKGRTGGDGSSFKDSFVRGAGKVADGADSFARKANDFTRRKMEEHQRRRARRQEERQYRAAEPAGSGLGGCLAALLKLALITLVVPVAAVFLAGCFAAVIFAFVGVVLGLTGFVVLGVLLPIVPLAAVFCAIFGLIFVVFFCITALMAALWLAKAIAVFARDLILGRRERYADDYYDREFRVSEDIDREHSGWHFGRSKKEDPWQQPAEEPVNEAESMDSDEEKGGEDHDEENL